MLKKGDRVLVVRKVAVDSTGEDMDWVRDMDGIVGREGVIESVWADGRGVAVLMDDFYGTWDISLEALASPHGDAPPRPDLAAPLDRRSVL